MYKLMCIFTTIPVMLRTKPIVFRTGPDIVRTNPVIFRTNPVSVKHFLSCSCIFQHITVYSSIGTRPLYALRLLDFMAFRLIDFSNQPFFKGLKGKDILIMFSSGNRS